MIDFKAFEKLVDEEVSVLRNHFTLKESSCELVERITGMPIYHYKCKFDLSELCISYQPFDIDAKQINLVSVTFEVGFRMLFIYSHACQVKDQSFDKNTFLYPPENMELEEGVRTIVKRNLDHVVKHMGDIVRGGSWPEGLGLDLNDFH